MNFYPKTARQTNFVNLARTLAGQIAPRAAQHDRAGSFAFENYADLRAAGLPSLPVPTDLGGLGAGLLESLMTVEELAKGDGSTALNLTMHMQVIGQAAEARMWPEHLFAEVCTAAVQHGALINVAATEPELGSPSRGGKPSTTAQPLYDDASNTPVVWLLNGRKSYASMCPTLDYIIIPAVLKDGSDDVARFLVRVADHRADDLSIVETWDALGMRSTGSHDLILNNVRVADSAIIARGDEPQSNKGSPVNAWFMLLVSATYLGVAEAALTTAAEYARTRVPTALGKPIAEVEGIQRQLGQASLLIHQAQLALYATAEMWDRRPEQRSNLGASVAVAKVTATNNAIAAVDHCMRAAGGASMSKSLPLERYYRDVRGGLLHPINDDAAYIMLGKLAVAR